MDSKRHRDLMSRAIERDRDAHQALFAGNKQAACAAFKAAADLYRESWEDAPPHSYGRLVGMLKSAILSGDAREYGTYAYDALAEDDSASAVAAYAHALAALILEEDVAAGAWAVEMHEESEALTRTADAIAAIAGRDREAYARALEAIVRDFEQRDEHLTGVAIADTALMLEQLAGPRGMTVAQRSPLLPG